MKNIRKTKKRGRYFMERPTRRSQTASMKNKNRKQSKRVYGGECGQPITNVEKIYFFLEVLTNKNFKQIRSNHSAYINSITITNEDEYNKLYSHFDFEKNVFFKNFINDLGRWFLSTYFAENSALFDVTCRFITKREDPSQINEKKKKKNDLLKILLNGMQSLPKILPILFKPIDISDPSNSIINKPLLDNCDISNTDTLNFIIDVLSHQRIRTIIDKHQVYINSITIDNFKVSVDFNENIQFRLFVNDIGQWFIFEYNANILKDLIDIINSCFTDTAVFNDPFDILIHYICQKIENLAKNQESKNEQNILKILLKILRVSQYISIKPSTGQALTGQALTGQALTGQALTGQALTGQALTNVKDMINTKIIANRAEISKNANTVICLLRVLQSSTNLNNIRMAITQFFNDLDSQKLTVAFKANGLSCFGSVVYDKLGSFFTWS